MDFVALWGKMQNFFSDLIKKKEEYNISVIVYTQSQFVTVERGCTGFMFTNIGDTIARVNGMVIFPSTTPATIIGDSRSIGAHKNDIYKGNIVLAFEAAGVNPAVEIVQVFYSNEQNK